MILLDTNVVSEAMRTTPDANVIEWLNDCDSAEICVSSVTVAEIAYGIYALEDGQRRDNLYERFKTFLNRGFRNRVLAFDETAAYFYGELMARRRSIGRSMSIADGQIAAIARCHGMSVATKDNSVFEATGLELIDPWAKI